MIDYSIAARPNPQDRDADPKYYACAQSNKVMELGEFARHISSHGSVYSRADVAAILTLAVDCLREMLLNGHKIQLGDLGNFYVSFNSKGVDNPQFFNPVEQIKAVKVNWERGASFLNLKEDAEFNQVAIRSVQKKVLKALKAGETTVSLVEEEEEI